MDKTLKEIKELLQIIKERMKTIEIKMQVYEKTNNQTESRNFKHDGYWYINWNHITDYVPQICHSQDRLSTELSVYPTIYQINKYSNNVFATEQDAIRYRDIHLQYLELVEKENQKNPIDWNNQEQGKWYLLMGFYNAIISDYNTNQYIMGIIYCSEENVRDLAIEKIGKNDLAWYLNHGRGIK